MTTWEQAQADIRRHDLVRIDSDLDTAARLVLLEHPNARLLQTVRILRAQGFEQFTAREFSEIWSRYRGFDGRTPPTHDIDTGRRISRG